MNESINRKHRYHGNPKQWPAYGFIHSTNLIDKASNGESLEHAEKTCSGSFMLGIGFLVTATILPFFTGQVWSSGFCFHAPMQFIEFHYITS